jgi:hypothetical protein
MPLYSQPSIFSVLSAIEPSSKFIGLEWREITGNGILKLWYWDGTRWLSQHKEESFSLYFNSDFYSGLFLNQQYNYLIKTLDYQLVNTTALDSTNKAEIAFKEWIGAFSGTSLFTRSYSAVASQSSTKESINIGQVIVPTAFNSLQIKSNRVGTAQFTFRGKITYHLIRK